MRQKSSHVVRPIALLWVTCAPLRPVTRGYYRTCAPCGLYSAAVHVLRTLDRTQWTQEALMYTSVRDRKLERMLRYTCILFALKKKKKKRTQQIVDSLLDKWPTPSWLPHFLYLWPEQQWRKHIFSQATSNWYHGALGIHRVVLVLSKNQRATLWNTTGYLQPRRRVWPRFLYSFIKKHTHKKNTALRRDPCQDVSSSSHTPQRRARVESDPGL